EADAALAQVLVRLDEGASDVAVFDQAFRVRDARFQRITDSRRRRRVRHAYHDVGARRVLFGKLAAHILAGRVERHLVDDAVGPGEIDVVENAQGLVDPWYVRVRGQPLVADG